MAMVNKSDARVFNALYVPWFNASLLKDMDVVVIRSALVSLATWATETTLKAIVGQRDAIQEWLETNNPNGEPVMAIVRTPALQDKDNEEEGDDDEEEDEEEDGAADECRPPRRMRTLFQRRPLGRTLAIGAHVRKHGVVCHSRMSNERARAWRSAAGRVHTYTRQHRVR